MNEDTDLKIIPSNVSNIQKTKTIGQSKFYDVTSSCAVTPEKQDEEKPDDYIEEGLLTLTSSMCHILIIVINCLLPSSELCILSDVQQEYTKFDAVTYLGCAQINAPKSEAEIQRNMKILAEQSTVPIKVSISVPSCSQGSVM